MKLNGFRATHRNKWLFIKERVLSIQELCLLEFYADNFDFDNEHSTFGEIKVNFVQIANIFGCSSQNTIRNWHKKLLDRGFIRKTDIREIYQLACCERYIAPSVKWKGKAAYYAQNETNQSLETILQNFGISFQSIGQKIQPIGKRRELLATNPITIAISSSKDDSSVSSRRIVIKQEARTEEEYQTLYEEVILRGGRLTINHMKWIDENVTEEIEVEPDELEQSVVETFFDGDWGNYRQHLIVS